MTKYTKYIQGKHKYVHVTTQVCVVTIRSRLVIVSAGFYTIHTLIHGCSIASSIVIRVIFSTKSFAFSDIFDHKYSFICNQIVSYTVHTHCTYTLYIHTVHTHRTYTLYIHRVRTINLRMAVV